MLRNRLPDASCMTGRFLNEVLSLNAQEFGDTAKPKSDYTFLNEVLSLNAQESVTGRLRVQHRPSSMKS